MRYYWKYFYIFLEYSGVPWKMNYAPADSTKPMDYLPVLASLNVPDLVVEKVCIFCAILNCSIGQWSVMRHHRGQVKNNEANVLQNDPKIIYLRYISASFFLISHHSRIKFPNAIFLSCLIIFDSTHRQYSCILSWNCNLLLFSMDCLFSGIFLLTYK